MKKILFIMLLCGVCLGYGTQRAVFRGRLPGPVSQPQHYVSNVLEISPDDNMQSAYNWLRDSAGNMGTLSAANPRYLRFLPGTYTGNITMDTDYIHLEADAPGVILSGTLTRSSGVNADILIWTDPDTGFNPGTPTLNVGSTDVTGLKAEDGFVTTRNSKTLDNNRYLLPVNDARTFMRTATGASDGTLSKMTDYRPSLIEDGLGVVCIKFSSIDDVVYTTNGSAFTELFDVNHSDFATYKAALTAASKAFQFFSVYKAADGAWLLSAGTTTAYSDSVVCSKVFRSTDRGTSWTEVLDMTYGYVPTWGWSPGDVGNGRMVIVEYGPKTQGSEQGKTVYISSDYGQTWDDIYAFSNDADSDKHLHIAVYDPTDTNYQTIYVTRGDEEDNRGTHKLTYNTPTWDQSFLFPIHQSTGGLAVGNYIYWSVDTTAAGTVIVKHDPSDDSMETMFNFPEIRTEANFTAYRPNSSSSFAISIVEKENLYWSAVRCGNTTDNYNCGLYVSGDCENWTCVTREMLSDTDHGIWHLAGIYDGKMWGGFSDGGTNWGFYCAVPDVKLLTATRSWEAQDNVLEDDSSSNDWSFEAASGNMSVNNDFTAGARSTDYALDGQYSYKATYGQDTSGFGNIIFPRIRGHLGVTPSVGDFVTYTFWMRFSDNWPEADNISLRMWGHTGTTEGTEFEAITAVSRGEHLFGGWDQFSVTGKILAAFGSEDLYANLVVGNLGYTEDQYVYIDCVSVYVNSSGPDTYHPLTVDDTVADYSEVDLVGVGNDYTVSFVWFPDTGYYNIQTGNIAIGRIEGVDDSYIDLYWKQSDSKFYAHDGTDTAIASTETYRPQFLDCIKVAVVGDLAGITVYVNDPLNGTITFGDGTDNALSSQPDVFRTAMNDSDYGMGSYARVRGFDTKLSSGDVTAVFNMVRPLD